MKKRKGYDFLVLQEGNKAITFNNTYNALKFLTSKKQNIPKDAFIYERNKDKKIIIGRWVKK